MAKRKCRKGQTTMYKTQHIKLKIPTEKLGVNSCVPEGYAVSVPLVAPVVLL
jgi:hypothetical protein